MPFHLTINYMARSVIYLVHKRPFLNIRSTKMFSEFATTKLDTSRFLIAEVNFPASNFHIYIKKKVVIVMW